MSKEKRKENKYPVLKRLLAQADRDRKVRMRGLDLMGLPAEYRYEILWARLQDNEVK